MTTSVNIKFEPVRLSTCAVSLKNVSETNLWFQVLFSEQLFILFGNILYYLLRTLW